MHGPMKAGDLVAKLNELKALLKEHQGLWRQSLDTTMPRYPRQNVKTLGEQQAALSRLVYVLDPYITRYSRGRIMRHPATGVSWDIYRSAIGNDTALIKGPSLQNAILELEGITAIVEQEQPAAELNEPVIKPIPGKNIFISHGRDSKALQKLERFIRTLGLNPIIVKNEPSRGGAVDDVIEENMKKCACAVILATKDDEVGGRWQPRPNVIHEIGLGQEKLKNSLIYLKEHGCEFPSNVSPKIWENFTQENMEDAFLKVVKELRAFGIVQ
jgi:predicted nucleotide-binding protein